MNMNVTVLGVESVNAASGVGRRHAFVCSELYNEPPKP